MFKTIVFTVIVICARFVFILISKREREDLEKHDKQNRTDSNKDKTEDFQDKEN